MISVAYITKDAARCFSQSLASISGLAAEVVVVDSGSTDDTCDIARRHGARVVVQAWQGFGKQKQGAVDLCTHPWVLVLDADEVLAPEAVAAIKDALRATDLPAAFSLPRHNFFHGRRIRFGDWSSDRVIRLVDRRQGRFSEDVVHEHWVSSGRVAPLYGPIRHYSFENYKAMLEKVDRYSDLNAQRLLARGQRVKSFQPLLHALGAFMRSYVLRLGILDGTDGAGIALTTALGAFMKYAKALEQQRSRPCQRP